LLLLLLLMPLPLPLLLLAPRRLHTIARLKNESDVSQLLFIETEDE